MVEVPTSTFGLPPGQSTRANRRNTTVLDWNLVTVCWAPGVSLLCRITTGVNLNELLVPGKLVASSVDLSFWIISILHLNETTLLRNSILN